MNTNKERPLVATAPLAEAPSDLELMMYFDGELEEPRKSAVSAFIAADLRAQNKLVALQITSGVVREYGRSSEPFDIADVVMKRIATDASTKVAASPVEAQRSNVVPISTAKKLSATPPVVRRPANDNVRRIFGVAALAVAAAAALAIWGRQTATPGNQGKDVQVAVTAPATSSQPGVAPTSAEPMIESVARLQPEGDSEHGVEVATVNFGAHMGSIFYVPSGSIEANHTTTVVWLADDAGE